MQNEVWQVEVNGKIYECEFVELEQWIVEHSLLPADKVRRGERGWIEAGRVPVLRNIFENRKLPTATDVATAAQAVGPPSPEPPPMAVAPALMRATPEANGSPSPKPKRISSPSGATADNCHFHVAEIAAYVCRACGQNFCKTCPKSFGSVRTCPLCGELCQPFQVVPAKQIKTVAHTRDLQKGYGWGDFTEAWFYPFKFWQSLGLGALFVALLSFGGFYGGLLANAILFGCMAQAISHIAHGEVERNFMPDFDDFNVFDDVLKPFLLSFGIFLVAFLPATVIMFALFFNVLNSLANPAAALKAEQENAQAIVNESPSTRILLEQPPREPEKPQTTEDLINAPRPASPLDEKDLKALINGNGDEQAAAARKVHDLSARNSAVPVSPAPQKSDWQAMFSLVEPILKSSFPLVLLLAIALLWAILYLPMALAIAGYTRSLTATINPLVGIDTMRRMGVVYLAALFFCLIVQFANLVLAAAVGYLTAPLDLPLVGNLPAKFIVGVCSFYLSIVMAFVLGSALYKTSDQLGIEIQ